MSEVLMLVKAWWDVHRQFQPGHNPRRRRSRPLKELERILGHRVEISDFWRYHQMPPDQYKYEAFSWIRADSIDDAVYCVLRQLSRIGGVLGFYPYALNRAAFASAIERESTVASFYWNTELQHPLSKFASGGVLLYVGAEERDPPRKSVSECHRSSAIGAYDIEVDLNVFGDPTEVRTFHLPAYLNIHKLSSFSLCGIAERSGPGNPNQVRLHRRLVGVSVAEAVCTALECVQRVQLRLVFSDTDLIVAKPLDIGANGLVGMRLTKSPLV